jgi:hypothetical protein
MLLQVQHYIEVSGNDVGSAVRRILALTFTNETAQQFTWDGDTGKPRAAALYVIAALFGELISLIAVFTNLSTPS